MTKAASHLGHQLNVSVLHAGRYVLRVQRVVVAEVQHEADAPPRRLLASQHLRHCPWVRRWLRQAPVVDKILHSKQQHNLAVDAFVCNGTMEGRHVRHRLRVASGCGSLQL